MLSIEKKLMSFAFSIFVASNCLAADESKTSDDSAKSTATEQAQPAAAKEKVSDTTDQLNPWVDCGIGAMLFDETKWAAVTSNVIWDYGITATTSAVSSKHTCEGKQVAAAFFIDTTYANLEEETANGSSEHTSALLNIFGCEDSAHSEATSAIRTQFASLLSSDSYAQATQRERAQQFYFMVNDVVSNQFAQQCDTATI